MSILSAIICGCEVKKGKGNYFVMCQLDQLPFKCPDPSDKKSEKFRTELVCETEYPRFIKNTFKFENVAIFEQLTLKFAVFSAPSSSKDTSDLMPVMHSLKTIFLFHK
jgi:hypothetical protein